MADEEYKPLTGDPDVIKSYGAKYQAIGEAIARSVTVLNKIAAGDAGKSKAIDALKGKAAEVAGDIAKAKDRYQQTAAALITYGPQLESAQQAANTAIAQINARQATLTSAQQTASDAQTAADTASDADKADATTKATAAAQAVTDASTDLAAAQAAWHSAESDKNTAATTAINAIKDVIYGPHAIKDSWWDNWGSKVFEIFKAVCKWASILSVFLSWVPVLGEVLLALAAIGAVIDVIDSVVKAINGEGSWWGVLGAVGTLALTIVGGGIAARLAKSFRSAAFLKVAPSIGRTLKGRQGLASIMGEDLVKEVMPVATSLSKKGLNRLVVKEGENLLTKANVKDELLASVATKIETTLGRGAEPDEAITDLAKLKSDGLKQIFKEGIIPDLRHPAQFIKEQAGLGGTYDNLARGIRLVIKDPHAVLGDSKAVMHLATTGGLAGAYQGYESYKAVHSHVENIVEGHWSDEAASLFTGGSEVKTIIDNAKSIEFKNNG